MREKKAINIEIGERVKAAREQATNRGVRHTKMFPQHGVTCPAVFLQFVERVHESRVQPMHGNIGADAEKPLRGSRHIQRPHTFRSSAGRQYAGAYRQVQGPQSVTVGHARRHY